MAMRRGLLWLLGGGVVVLGLAAAALLPRMAMPPGITIGGPFALVDGDGHAVSERSYAGLWKLVYFGYTHCPDACPTTLSTIGAAMDKLTPGQRRDIRVLFITVDPGRDSPQVIGSYVKAFGPEFIGLTGSPAALAPVESSYHVYAARHALKDGDYAMDHSSIIYVMAPDGHFVGLLDDNLTPEAMAKKLVALGA
jgi:protein SCO1/2